MRRLGVVLAVAPLVIAVVIAGVVSSPSKVRPCVTEFSEGITGYPTHLVLGPEGDLYASEEEQKQILRFDPETHRAREYKVGVKPHDLTIGPDRNVWFVSYTADALGMLDPETGRVTRYEGLSPDSEPHMLRWSDDGRLYITEQKQGQLAVFDPETEEIREDDFGLPPDNYIHNIVELPNGDLWAVLQEGDALARFNLKRQRFDKFVELPEDSGPRDITYVRSRNAIYATLFAANEIVEYDLDTERLTLHETHLDPISYADALSRKPLAKLTFLRPDAKQDAIWVATLAGGELLRLDLDTKTIERVGCGSTIPNGPLGIANDRRGRLWYAVPFPKGAMARVEM